MKSFLLSLLFFFPILITAQPAESYIEVVGTAEKSIVPDEIYIVIDLKERYKGKTKVTIEKQEKKLKEALIENGIYLNKLSLQDAEAGYVKVNWKKKDVIASKKFLLKTANAEEVGKVFMLLDELEIKDASISRVDHSELEAYKKEVKIEAIKAAKEKALYLLKAIGEKPGKPIAIYENSPVYASNIRGNVDGLYVQENKSISSSEVAYEIQFEKIVVRSSIYLKYSIE